MKAWIYDKNGQGWTLPALLTWDISHGFGSPCDGFEVKFLHKEGMEDILSRAVEFKAEHSGAVVFRGRVDEFVLSASAVGAIVTLSGRGMQALLLDNEAESAEYYNADLDFILNRHARSVGIEDIDTNGAAGAAASFSVESGMSHWGVIEEFARLCCGVRPRFSPEGVLILDGEHGGGSFTVDKSTPVTAMEYSQDRYGAVSRVTVKKYSGGGEISVDNAELQALGGSCSRVINVPKKTSYDSMRYTAQYQIKRSMEDFRRCSLTLPQLFAAFPGDRVEIKASPLGLTGTFLVVGSRCRGGAEGGECQLDMRRI